MKEWIAQLGSQLWHRTAFLRSATGLVVLAVSFVGLRLLWIHAQRPADLEANAAAYGAIRQFYGPAHFNHAGSQFVFAATADDRGRAIFLGDTLTGSKRQIVEDRLGVGAWKDDFDVQAGPWSPDDRYFLCIVSNRLMVCSADADPERVVIGDKPFSQAAWLNPGAFAYVTDGSTLRLGQKREDGQWEQKTILRRNFPMTSLTAIGPDTVAWVENGEVIYQAEMSEGGSASTLSASAASRPPSLMATNDLVLWLDASKLRQADQEQVMVLPDLSRSKNDAVWNGTPPVFNATNNPRALNGKGTIHFNRLGSPTNGTGLKTRSPLGIAGSAPRSVFVVMRHEQDRPMMVSMGDTSAHGALFAVEWSERLFLPTGWWADNYVDASSTNWNMLGVVYDGTKQKGYLNGLLRCTGSAKLNTVERGMRIGFRDGSDAKAAEGDFAELLVYSRALGISERLQVEEYLRVKWLGARPADAGVSPVATLEGVTGVTGSRETGELLINRTENGRDSIWRVNTARGPGGSPVQVMEGQSMRGAQWAGPGRFVYASHLDTRHSLTLAGVSGEAQKQLLQLWGAGNFDWFRATPKQLFLFGNISNTMAANLWGCDLESGAWRAVISTSDYPSDQPVTAQREPRKLPGGNPTCTIYRPANFDKNRKYPLVIGDTMITDPIYGEPFMTGMAACGAVVAVVERPWWTVGIEQWAENVQGLYDQLKSDPTVDTRRVYLFAASAETQYLSKLMATNAAPWRGLILLNPGLLPDFSQTPWFLTRPRILLDAGGEEHMEERFKKYQQEALAHGVVVDFFTHPGETHRTVGITAKLERSQEMMRFIFKQ